MTLKPWHKSLILAALSIASAVLAYVSLSQPWYHFDDWQSSDFSGSTWGQEYKFYLNEWTHSFYHNETISQLNTFTYHGPSYFWVPLEPIHSFMNTIEMLVVLSIVLAVLVAALAMIRFQNTQLIASAASVALFASVPIAFFLGIVDAVNETDFPFLDELTGFIGDETASSYSSDTTVVWGPMSSWWLMIVACAVQFAGLVFAFRLRKK